MKLLSTIFLSSLSLVTIANAQTTMCFKENHKSMSTIENTKLDGGLCQGQNSVIDMTNQGWDTDDIKINKSDTGFNYIYIFKKQSSSKYSSFNESDKDIEDRVIARIKKEEEIKKEIQKKKEIKKAYDSGKLDYVNKCQNCHGVKGEKEYGTSRVINNFTLEEFQAIMRDYANMSYDRGQGSIMYAPSQTITTKDTKNIYLYLESLK